MPAKAWIKRIRKGDVLKARNGVLRVVRDVSHSGPSNGKTSVTFAIRHCSWTHRPYTVLTGNDLVQFGYRPTKAHVALRKKIDREIERDFNGRLVSANGRRISCPVLGTDRRIDCCDVRGMA